LILLPTVYLSHLMLAIRFMAMHATQLMSVDTEAAGTWLCAVMRDVKLPERAQPLAKFVQETYSAKQCATFMGRWVRHLRVEGACGSTLEQLMDGAAIPSGSGEQNTGVN
jgi:hypothetical protein